MDFTLQTIIIWFIIFGLFYFVFFYKFDYEKDSSVRADSLNFVKSILINLIASYISVFSYNKFYSILLEYVKENSKDINEYNLLVTNYENSEIIKLIKESKYELSSYSNFWIILLSLILILIILNFCTEKNYGKAFKDSVQEILVCILVYTFLIAIIFKNEYSYLVSSVIVLITLFLNALNRLIYYRNRDC